MQIRKIRVESKIQVQNNFDITSNEKRRCNCNRVPSIPFKHSGFLSTVIIAEIKKNLIQFLNFGTVVIIGFRHCSGVSLWFV